MLPLMLFWTDGYFSNLWTCLGQAQAFTNFYKHTAIQIHLHFWSYTQRKKERNTKRVKEFHSPFCPSHVTSIDLSLNPSTLWLGHWIKVERFPRQVKESFEQMLTKQQVKYRDTKGSFSEKMSEVHFWLHHLWWWAMLSQGPIRALYTSPNEKQLRRRKRLRWQPSDDHCIHELYHQYWSARVEPCCHSILLLHIESQ